MDRDESSYGVNSAGREVILELQDVYLDYNSRRTAFDHGIHHVLQGPSLKLYRGETLGIIGRNGVGKSTILRLMAGIISPTRGSVKLLNGVSAALLTLGLGYRPQLSGSDNALIASMLQGATRKEAESCLQQIKEFSELGESFDEPVKTYSTGMRARLGFATALITHVDILLIDEVLAVGDGRFRKKAEQALQDKMRGNEQTVVVVSHVMQQVERICDRLIWLENGCIEAEGGVGFVLEKYNKSIQSN